MKKLILSLALTCSLFAAATVTIETAPTQKEINEKQSIVNEQQAEINNQ